MSRRHSLKVDTFPFLAVLLCAMGSLILVLLVMDRRSKLAVRQQAAEQVRRQTEDHSSARARREEYVAKKRSRDAAWNKKREALTDRVSAEEKALDAELRKVQAKLAEAARKLRKEEENVEALRGLLKGEQTKLATQEKALDGARDESRTLSSKLSDADKARAKLADELAQLETLLQGMQDTRKRDTATYSLVPYNGKRGDNRRPLYVECSEAGMLFHPDKLKLDAPAAEALRAEVKKRIEKQASELAAEGVKDAKPYIMLLVRPNGVMRHYEMQVIARELSIDFGYEFVDADWILSIPDKGAPDTTRIAKETGSASSSAPRLVSRQGGQGERSANGGAAGMESSTPQSGGRTTAGPSGEPGEESSTPQSNASPGLPGFSPGHSTAGPSSMPGIDSSRPQSYGQPGLPGFSPAHTTAVPSGVAGAESSTPPIGIGAPTGQSMSEGGPTLPSVAHDSLPLPPVGSGSSAPTVGQSAPRTHSGSNSQGHEGSDSPVVSLHRPVARPTDKPSNGIEVPTLVPNSNSSPSGQPSGGGTKAETGPKFPAMSPTQPNEGGSMSPPQTNGGNATPQPVGSGDGSGGDSGSANEPAPKFANTPPVRSSNPLPLRPARISGNEDTVIYIECRPDTVVVYPGRKQIGIDSLNHTAPHNPLTQTVSKYIAGRQAQARAGMPPTRFLIRFLVHPSCERTLHRATDALETISFPKTRYSLMADDDVNKIVAGY